MCCHCPFLSAMLPSDILSFLGVLYPISAPFSRSSAKPESQPGSISVWQRDGTLHIEGPLTDWHHKLLMRRSLLVTTQKGVAWKEGSIKHISFHSESRSYATYDDDEYSKGFIQFVWSFCSRGNITNSSSICSYYFDKSQVLLLIARSGKRPMQWIWSRILHCKRSPFHKIYFKTFTQSWPLGSRPMWKAKSSWPSCPWSLET